MMRFFAFTVLSGMALCANAGGQTTDKEQSALQASDSSSGLTVGIDSKTGKMRALTDSEIQELSTLTKTQAAASQQAPVSQAKARVAPVGSMKGQPATVQDAQATIRTDAKEGSTVLIPLSSMSSLTAVMDADGRLHLSEDGETHAPVSKEVQK